MDSPTFWKLTLYDWTLWVHRIKAERKKIETLQELEWVRFSYLMAQVRNSTGGKGNGQGFKPEDFYIPSWNKGKTEEIKEMTQEDKEEILSRFPRNFEDIKTLDVKLKKV